VVRIKIVACILFTEICNSIIDLPVSYFLKKKKKKNVDQN